MKNNIILNQSQVFLRYLKKNKIYNDYIRELNLSGKTHILSYKNKTNPFPLEHISMTDLFWSNMMDWSNDDNYNVNGHDNSFWRSIDKKWVTIWGESWANRVSIKKDNVCIRLTENILNSIM